MRIAVNTRFLIKDKMEGVGWHNYELCKAMVTQHPEDEFIFLFDRPFDRQFLFADNVRGVFLPPPARRPLLWDLWFDWVLPAYFNFAKPDVFLSMDGYCSLRSKIPTVLVSHDLAYLHYPDQIPAWALRYYQRKIPLFLERADRILTVSEFGKTDMLEHFAISAEKIAVAPNALRGEFKALNSDEKQAIKFAYADGQDYFFYLGAVHPRKNVHRLILAFDQFKQETKSPVRLLIAGRFAWQTGEIQDAYNQVECKEDIQFLGYVPDDELKKILGAALALTYISLFEGFGLPILEAMHCEVPVITSNVSAMPEVAGKAALLVDPFSIDGIATSLRNIYTNADLRTQLTEQGVKERARYNWDHSARIIYKNILKSV
ncbi:MAG: glycosyltransferase family 1 protein [Bacteroidota bacterium]